MDEISINSLANPQFSLCLKCFNKLKKIYQKFDINGHDCLALYEYDGMMKSLIFQFKGCYDFELKDIFLERFHNFLKLKYHDYYLIPVPSSVEDDRARGFNHVDEVFKTMNLPIIYCIKKTQKMKQSDKSAEERKGISKFLKLEDGINLTSKKLLIVDDIHTTGSTLKACFELLEKCHPSKISALVLCKTRDLDER